MRARLEQQALGHRCKGRCKQWLTSSQQQPLPSGKGGLTRIRVLAQRRRWGGACSMPLMIALLVSLMGSTGSSSAKLELGATTVRPGESFDITITAPEWDSNPSGIGVLRVLVTCDKINEPAHEANLIETDIASGIFVGRMATILSTAAALPLPGLINVVPGTRIKVAYNNNVLTATIRVLFPGVFALPTSIAIGDDLNLILQDPDMNLDSTVKDSVRVTLAVSCTKSIPPLQCPLEMQERLTQGVESVQLRETTPDSGFFTGVVKTFLQEGSLAPHATPGDQGIDLRGASSSCGADEVTVTYNDAAPAAKRTAVIRAAFRANLLFSRSHITAGVNQTVNITLMDGDLLNVTSVNVSVSASKTDEPPETVVLQSTGRCQGMPTFVGTFYTHALRAEPVDGDLALQVRPGDILTISYLDEAPEVVIQKYLRVLTDASLLVGPSRAGKSLLMGDTTIATVEQGGNLTVTVTDKDRDSDPYFVDSISVEVAVADNSSRSFVTLVETGFSTGIFTAAHPVKTNASCLSVTCKSSSLVASEGASVIVQYFDRVANGNEILLQGYARVASNGTISIQTSSNIPAPGDILSITVVDVDLDQLNTTSESVSVFVRADNTGDTRVVQLVERSVSSAIFTGEVMTSTTPNASKLLVSESKASAGTVIEAAYSDAIPLATTMVRLRMCSSAELTVRPRYFMPGSSISITLIDADLQGDVLAIETATVSLAAPQETESLKLIETGWATSTFTGVMITSTSNTINGDGVIKVRECCGNRDTVIVSYTESCPSRTLWSIPSEAAVLGTLSAPLLVKPGDTIIITITHTYLNKNSSKFDSYSGLLNVSANNQTSSVMVNETGTNTGIFTGALQTSLNPSDGKLVLPILSGVQSSPILVTFTDVIEGVEPLAMVLETQRRGAIEMVQTGVEAGRIAIGQSVLVVVYDKDLDYAGGLVNVQLDKTGTFDRVTISLTEDGLGQGRYTGTFLTSSESGPANDNTLHNLLTGQTVTATYTDTDNSTSSAAFLAGIAGTLNFSYSGGGLFNVFTQFVDVILTDADLNTDPAVQETYIYSGTTGVVVLERETRSFALEMKEETVNSGRFICRIMFDLTVNAALMSCGGVINASCTIPKFLPTGRFDLSPRWDRAFVEYTDPEIQTGARVRGSRPAVRGSRPVRAFLAPGQDALLLVPSPATVVAGAFLKVTVKDQDMSKDAENSERCTVEVRNTGTDRKLERVQTITLTETNLQSEFFTGELRTYNDLATNTNVDGGINVAEGEVLSVSYVDQNRLESSTVTTFKDVKVIGWNTCRGGRLHGQMCSGVGDSISCGTGYCGSSKPSLVVGLFKVGSCVKVTLRDPDRNTDDISIQRVEIEVENILRKDRELLTLVEESTDSEAFTGCIQSVPVAADGIGTEMDGIMSVLGGDEVSVRFDDTVPVLSISRTIVAIHTQIAQLSVAPQKLNPGDAMRITLVDADEDENSRQAEFVQVSVGARGGSFAMNLIETGNATGVFTGIVSTSLGQPSIVAGLGPGDVVTVSYLDELPDGTTRSTSAIVGHVGLLAMSEIRLEGTSSVTLTDADAPDSLEIEASLRVLAQNGNVLYTKAIFLYRTAIPTVFVGHYTITAATFVANANSKMNPILLGVDLDMTINLIYFDSSPQLNVSRSISVVSSTSGTLYVPTDIPSGTPLFVTLADQDLNLDSSAIEISTVKVSSSNAEQSEEMIVLYETSPSSGTFTALLNTQQGLANARMNDQAMDSNPGDKLTVSYQERSPARVVSSVVRVTTSTQGVLSLSSYKVRRGEILFITVQDSDLDLASSATDVAEVEVLFGNASVRVDLVETDLSSARFTGALETARMRLDTKGNNELAVTYIDAAPANQIVSQAKFIASEVGTIHIGPSAGEFLYDTKSGIKVRTVAAGDLLAVTVEDADLNSNAQAVEVSMVTFYTSRNDQLAEVFIFETGIDSKTFTGTLATRLVQSALGGKVDIMDVLYGDRISAFYDDKAPAATIPSAAVIRIATPGRIFLTPASAVAGTEFNIMLYDQDLDHNATLNEETFVNIISSRIIGAVYKVKLVETEVSSGIFTGSIRSQDRTTEALAQHGIINVEVGDILAVEYSDIFPTAAVVRAKALVLSRSCGCANITTDVSNIAVGEIVTVTVYDPDMNKQKNAIDTLLVVITNVDRPKQIYTQMELRETALNSSIFVGELQAKDNKIQPETFVGNSDEINVDAGSNLKLNYRSISPTGTIDKTTFVYVQYTAELSVAPKPLLAGGVATITLRDDDKDISDTIDQAIARVTSSRAQEPAKEITLIETGAKSGIFTGVFIAREDSKTGMLSDTSNINVDSGDILTVSYQETLPTIRRAQVMLPIAQIATVTIGPVPLRANGMLTVEVSDVDANFNPMQIEFLTVNVSTVNVLTGAKGVSRRLELTETGMSTGVFTTSLAMSSNASESIIKLAPIQDKEMLTASYYDPAPAGMIKLEKEVLESAESLLSTATSLKAGARLAVTVTDPDLNDKSAESIVVTADAYRPDLTPGVSPGTYIQQGRCQVRLRKETPYSTSFHGFLETGISEDAPNCLHVVAADKIKIFYSEPAPLANITTQVSVLSSSEGSIKVSKQKLSVEGSVNVTVTDADLDTIGNKVEKITVDVQSSASVLAPITLTLTETSTSSSIFTGTVKIKPWTVCTLDNWGCTQYLTKAASGEDMLFVSPGQTVSFTYTDAAPYNVKQSNIPVCTTAKMEVHPLVIAIGWNITIYVDDADRAGTGMVGATVSVANGKYLAINLIEYAPGKFMGAAATSFLNENKNGTIQMTEDSSLYIVFSDDCPGNSMMVQVKAYKLGTITFSPDSIQVGEMTSILVQDPQNAKGSSSPEIQVICVGSLGDERTIVLKDASSGKGLYSGTIIPGLAGEISALHATSISCRYPLLLPPSLLIQTASIRRSFAGVLSASPQVIDTGGVLTISVNDKDLNTNPTSVEKHPSRIVVKTSADSKVLELTETSVDSAVFTGMVIVAETVQKGQTLDTLLGSDKDFVTTTYMDNAPRGTKELKVPVSASNVGDLRIKPELILLGSELQVLIADADLNRDPNKVESASVTVTVRSQGSSDGIVNNLGVRHLMNAVVLMNEMTTNTHFFTGKLVTIEVTDARAKPATPGFENVIYVMANYEVTLTYADAAPLGLRQIFKVAIDSNVGQLSFKPNPPTIGQALTITVVDADLEYDPARDILPAVYYSAGPSNCDVFGSNPNCRDVGMLPIVPTIAGGSVFTGELSLFDGIAIGNAGPCFLTCFDVSTKEGQFIKFTYADAAPKGILEGQVKVATRARLDVKPVGLEGVVDVTVFDEDLNQNDSLPEMGLAYVERDSSFAISSMFVNLTETGGNTGFFTGILVTTASVSAPARTMPQVAVGQNITVRYYDLSPEKVWRAQSSLVIPSRLGVLNFTSTGERIGNTFMKPARLTYYLFDGDLNKDPFRTDISYIQVTSSDARQGSEAVTMVENGFNTGVFTADLLCTVGSFNGIPNNLAMDVNEGDFITAVYQDIYPYKSVINVAKVATVGRVIVNPSRITAGRNINITVIDADLNTNKITVDGGSVLIFDNERNDNETVILTEVSSDSSTFTGFTSSSTAKGRILGTLSGLYEGGAAHAIYIDTIPEYQKNDCKQCSVTNKVAMTGNVTVSPSLLPLEGSLTVTVVDADLNVDSTVNETGQVEVRQFFREPFDLRILTVRETGPNTNTFTGVQGTSTTFIPGRFGNNSGGLYGPEGGRILVDYFDQDPFPSTIRSAGITRLSMQGSISVGPSPINPNDQVTITVRDDDLDLTTDVDVLQAAPVLVFSANDIWNNQGISVLLRETGASTGIFTGSRDTQENQATAAGVKVSGAIQGSYITATYRDPVPNQLYTARTRVATVANLTVSPSVFYEGQTISVTVTDHDLNDNPAIVERHFLNVSQSSANPDIVSLTIVETSNSSNVFTGVLRTSFSGGAGILKAPEGSEIRVSYLDKNPTPSRTLDFRRRVSIRGQVYVNTATFGAQGTTTFKPTMLSPTNTAITSCFIKPDQTDCSGTCLCRSLPKIVVTVIDVDLEGSALPSVIVYNKKGLEFETITMVSTGIPSTFSGELSVTDNAVEGTSNSGSLNVVPGDIIQVAYVDVAPPRNVLVDYRIPSVGRAEFVPPLSSQGRPQTWTTAGPVVVGVDDLNLQLTDLDLSGQTSANVAVSGNTGADSEVVTLQVTNSPGVFTAKIATESNYRGVKAQDGKLQVHFEDTVKVVYIDALPASTGNHMGMELGTNVIKFRAELLSNQRVIPPNGRVLITLVDADLPKLATPSTEAFVEVSTAADPYPLTVTLAENSRATGVYTGFAQTSTRQNLLPGLIDAATPGSKITVKYLDCNDKSIQSYVYNVASQGIITFATTVAESMAAGLPITVYLNDTDQDSSPAVDSAPVIITKEGAKVDSETLNLRETGGRTGFFTGVLNTSFDDTTGLLNVSNASNGVLDSCNRGDTVTATYRHATLGENTMAYMRFLSEAGVVNIRNRSQPIFPNEIITITVIDLDLNADIYEAETYRSLVAVDTGVDTEWVSIKETSRSSRHFTGIMQTSSVPGASYDGTLNIIYNASRGSIATFVYNDTVLNGKYPRMCQTSGLPHGCHIQSRRAYSAGELMLSQSAHAEIGKPIGVTVLDGDLNADFNKSDTTVVEITKASGGDVVLLPLTESGRNTGIFTGSISVSGTGTKNDALTFSYSDAVPVRRQTVSIVPRYLGNLSDTFNVILPGGAVRISLTDKDLDANTAVVETFSVIYVTNIMTHQREQVILTETGVTAGTAGTFTGILNTLTDKSRGNDFSGSMNVQAGDLLNVLYSDSGPAVAITRDVRVATIGEVTKSPMLIAVEAPMIITVSDLDMDRDVLAVDTISNLLRIAKGTLIPKSVVLTETGLSTGLFTGQITLTGGITSESKFGPVAAWESITITYEDQMPLDKIEKIFPIFAQGSVSLSPWPWIDVAKDILTITVADMDLNRDALIAETVSAESDQVFLTIYSGSDKLDVRDREYLSLTETSRNSGIFTSVIEVRGGGLRTDNDGILGPITMSGGLGVTSGHIIEASYFDVAPSRRIVRESYPSNIGVIDVKPCKNPGLSPCQAVVGAGVMMTVTVTDRDLNLDPLLQELVTVTVGTDREREPVETVTLTECREDGIFGCVPHVHSNVFVGYIQTVGSASFSAQGDGQLNVLPGNCDNSCSGCSTGTCQGFLIIQYQDVSPVASIKKFAKVGHVGKIDICGNNLGKPLDYCLFGDSSEVTITVTDPGLNLSPTAVDVYDGAVGTSRAIRVSVQAQYSAHPNRELVTSDSVRIAVKETNVNSNVFTGTFSFVAASDTAVGSLKIFNENSQDILRSASTIVTATFEDETSKNPKAYARMRTTSTIIMKTPTCTDSRACTNPKTPTCTDSRTCPDPIQIGKHPLTISVIDGDMDQDRLKAETVKIKVKTKSTSAPSGKSVEQELVLTETGLSTGIFAATAKTAVAKQGFMPSVLTCDSSIIYAYEEENLKFSATYSELAPLGDNNLEPALGLTAAWPATITITPNTTWLGSTITVTVQDFDLKGTSQNVQVSISSDYVVTPEQPTRTIVLAVTNMADTFTGTWLVDGSFLGTPAGTQRRRVTASYVDVSHDSIVRSFDAQLASRGILTAASFADTISSVSITLQDSSVDLLDIVETLRPGVVVETEVGGRNGACDYCDRESLALVETGPTTSTFTGVLPMVRATAKNRGDGILQGDLGKLSQGTGLTVPTITVTYEDQFPPLPIQILKLIECEGRVIVPRTFTPNQPFTVTVSDCDLAASNAPGNPSYLANISISLKTDRGNITSTNITALPKFATGATNFNITKYEAVYTGTVTTSLPMDATKIIHSLVSNQDVGSVVTVMYEDSAPSRWSQADTVASVLGQVNISSTYNSRVSTNTKYKIDSKSLLTVRDRDANVNTSAVDSVTVIAQTDTDEESITLLETGINANTFTGWLPADRIGANVRGDKMLSPVASYIPINIRYPDPAPEMNVTVVAVGSDFGSLQVASPVMPFNGAPVRATVVDSDLDSRNGSLETYTNLLELSRCSPRRNIGCLNASTTYQYPESFTGTYCEKAKMTLVEAAASSSTFTGQLSALTCLNEQNDLRLGNTMSDNKFYVVCEGLDICNVTAIYTDEAWGEFTTTVRTSRSGLMRTSQLHSVAGAGTFVVGEALQITVTDADLDTNAFLVESTAVSFNNSYGPPEMLVLTETGNSTGIFTGSAVTIEKGSEIKQYLGVETPEAREPLAVFTPSVPAPKAGKFQVDPGLNLSISYYDTSPSGNVVTRTLSPRRRATIEATPFPLLSWFEFFAPEITYGPVVRQESAVGITNVTVTVVDLDASVSTDSLSVNVSVYAGANTTWVDHEIMVLNETGSATGIFTGIMAVEQINLTAGAASIFLSRKLISNLKQQDYKLKITYFQVGTGGSNGTKSPTVYRKVAENAKLDATKDLPAGAIFYITVTDVDQDIDWERLDTVLVQVTSNKLHEGSEAVTLSETALSSGIFTGKLVTTANDIAGGPNDAIMNVVAGNSLRVAYVEPFNRYGKAALLTKEINITAGGYRGQVMFVDPDRVGAIGDQRYAKSMLINDGQDVLSIMVVDSDAKATVYGTRITVTTPLQSVSYTLGQNNTQDVGQSRYVMTVPITKKMGTDVILGGFEMGNIITLSYYDILPYEVITTQGVVNKAALLQATPQPIGMGDTLTITVTDPDLNQDDQSPNVGTVFVRSSRSTEGTESVPITETGASTNVFTGLLRTALRKQVGASNTGAGDGLAGATGSMNVAMTDVLTLSYVEKARNSMITDATKLKTITIQVGMPAVLKVTQVVLPAGWLVISVTDNDLNLTPENMKYANVTVSTSKDFETEVVRLTQTGSSTGIFTGVLLTCTRCKGANCPDVCFTPPCTCVIDSTCVNSNGPLPMNCPSEVEGPSNDGVLYVEQGNLITTRYFERMPEQTLSAFSHVPRLGSLTTVPETYLVPGGDITVIVLDNDGNKDPNAIEQVDVDIASAKIGEPNELLKLTEDDANSGRFVGTLKTIASTPSKVNTLPQDGSLAVDAGETVQVIYRDVFTFEGIATPITSKLTVASAGDLMVCAVNFVADPGKCLHWSYVDDGITIYMALPGESLAVNVTDIDLALDADTASVSAYISPTRTADYEVLILPLKGNSIFSGSLRSDIRNISTPMDGILTLTGDSEITFTYVDEVPRVTKRAIIRMATKGVLQVGPRLFNGFPALSINLTDGDLNTKASVREVVTVEVVNQRFPDQIARVGLLESAPSSGFFQGSITLTYASTAETVNDGTLRGLSGDLVNVSYQDALPESLVQMTTALRFAGGLQVSNSMVAGNELFSVSLFDGDLNSDKTKSDLIIGVLSLNSDLQGPIMVSMTETGVENGIFTASILPRLEGTSIEIDAIDPLNHAYQVRVAKGKDLRLTYIDPDNGIPVGKTVTVFTKAHISLAVIYSGKNVVLQVTMTDADLMGSSAALTAQVYTSDANQPVETVELTATSVGSEVFTGNVLAQAHMGVTPAGKISLRDTDTIFVRYYDEQPATVIVEEVSAPKPRFLEPTPFDDTKFVTAVDCVFQIGLRGADRSVESKRLIGATVVIKATRYRDKDGTFKNGVIPGGSLSYAEPGTSFETSMSWRPRPEQEGGVFISCFAVMESHSLVTTVIVNNTERSITERCFEISVMQCRKCALPGETLNQIALLLGSEWLTVWSLNPKIKMPQEVLDGTLVNTSLVYKVIKGDSMASLSMRFGTTVKFLLAINADLTVSGDLKVGQTICVLPNQVALDGCPQQARSTTWEKLEEQYVPVDYFDNPFNWEDIQWTDLGGKPVKKDNPDYPQLPARKVEKELGYSKRQNVVA